ncbi:hypothetical protein [Olivibacter sitiensis]|uniref:hypothetical protein n=1 Tax=Olivibacter sitiensis TaxID=376470 RepID=UPI0003FE2F8C|nr:hypothetical protein [Olivibacter sitiensis]
MKTFVKWFLGIIAFLAILLGGGLWYLSNHWRPLLNEQIHALVISSSDSLYHVEYDDFDFNLATGNAEVRNFRLIPDTNVYNQLKAQQKAPDNLYELEVAKLLIRDFHPRRIYSERRLNIDQIVIDHPTIKIINDNQPYNDTVQHNGDEKSLYERISPVMKELRVEHVALKNIDFTHVNRSNRQEKSTSLRNVNVNVTDILIDSTSQKDLNRFYNAKSVDFELDKYRMATGDSLYYLDVDGIAFSTSRRSISLGKVKLTPRYNRTDFYKKVKLAKERYDIAFDSLSINNIDLFKLVKQQKLFAGNLKLGKGTVEIYKNGLYPKKPKKAKVHAFPIQQLSKLALDLKIDTLLLGEAFIRYTELNGKTQQTGSVFFSKTHGSFYNITNDSASLAKNKVLTAKIDSRFMGNGHLDITFKFDQKDQWGAFSYSGSLKNMNGTALNPLTKPLAMIEVSSGNLNDLRFDVQANEKLAKGMVSFRYNNLKAVILKKDDKTGKVAKMGMVSTLANAFIINDSNPDANDMFHPGPIHYQRPPEASFFNFLWKSLFEGVKASVGVSKEREARLMNTAEGASGTAKKVKGFFKGVFGKEKEKK